MTRRKTQEEFIQESIKIHGNHYDYSEVNYKNTHIKVKIYCKKCKEYFYQTPHHHIKGCGCPRCANNIKLTEDIIIKRIIKIFGKNKFNFDKLKYKNYDKKVKIYCNDCKKYFYRTPHKLLSGKGFGCPNCNKSSGERIIYNFLTDNKIQFKFQKIFKDCKDVQPLRFDFYLINYNMCIEYQGQQHYEPQLYIWKYKTKLKGIEAFKKQKLHDKMKREYCKKNNIKLLEIKYNENIIEKIKKNLNI